MKKKIVCIILSLFLIIFTLASCDSVEKPDNGKTEDIKIITTLFPIYDWVRNITGKEAVYLDESGIDLHSFEPTASDIIQLSDADLFIYIGGESDKWVANALKSANNPKLVSLALIDSINALEEETVEGMESEEEEEDEGVPDEHIWLSVKNASQCVKTITDAICKIDPENEKTYTANAENYINELNLLDEKYASAVKNATGNTLLFADRFPFRYLTEDYNIEYYAAFPGCSSESAASFDTISFLINKTNELSLPCIIKLETSDGKLAETIKSSTGAQVVTMNSCQSVSKKDVESGITYISVMEENLNIITQSLA